MPPRRRAVAEQSTRPVHLAPRPTLEDPPMGRVTAEQVRDAIAERQITEWPLRACARCGEPVAYVFRNGLVFFDPACGCSLRAMELRTWREVADTLNRQTPEIRARMWREMLHLPVEETS